MVYRLNCWHDLKRAIPGYYVESVDYNTFLARNFRWVFVLFAYASIVLNALQVGLTTAEGQQNSFFNRFGWVSAILVMAMLAAGIVSAVAAVLIVVLENATFALKMLKKAFPHTRKIPV